MPTLTPHEDMSPSPRVDIVFDAGELDVATDTISVYQISAAGQIDVRDATGVSASGGFAVTDFEVPLGVEVTYQAQQYDVSGAVIGLTDSASTQVDVAEGWAVFSDPLAPNNAILLQCEPRFANRLVRRRDQRIYRVGFQTIALQGELGLLSGVPLRVYTTTSDEADDLETILYEGTSLVRTMPAMPLPRLFYAAFQEIPVDPFEAPFGGSWSVFELEGEQVSRPSLGTLVPAVTYGVFVDYYTGATYGDTLTDYTTYLDSIINAPAEA
jgi:hypothetical protein